MWTSGSSAWRVFCQLAVGIASISSLAADRVLRASGVGGVIGSKSDQLTPTRACVGKAEGLGIPAINSIVWPSVSESVLRQAFGRMIVASTNGSPPFRFPPVCEAPPFECKRSSSRKPKRKFPRALVNSFTRGFLTSENSPIVGDQGPTLPFQVSRSKRGTNFLSGAAPERSLKDSPPSPTHHRFEKPLPAKSSGHAWE